MLSCVGEPTAPQKTTERFARGLTFNPVFPQGLSLFGAADQFTFDRVHVVLRHSDGSVALDTTVAFPPNATEVRLTLDVRLLPGSPLTGERLTLEVQYLNVQQEIFRGGVEILATPTVPGAPAPPPVSVPDVNLVYTGPGASATIVRIAPRTLSVNTGAPFTFTATATDATGNVVPNTPIAWTSLDPTRATITAPTAGTGVALNQRGTARIVAQLVGGQKDTVTLNVLPVATAVAAVSGGGQTGIVGKPVTSPLAQPLVVRVTAADGLGVPGATVNFAAANGGTVSPASAVTDANGLAQTSWTLGPLAGTQTATATVAGLSGSPVSFSATAQATVATKLAFTTAPAAASPVSAGAPIALAVAAQDAAGDPVVGFTGPITLSLGGGAATASLAGTTTVNAVAGVATFTNISIAAPGTGYVIAAGSSGLTSASTPAFDVVSGPAANMQVVSGGGQTAAASTALAPITVLLTDASGNAKPNTIVFFAVTSGGGSVTPASVPTDAQGRATATWTLGAATGTQTMSASSVGVTTLSVSATATSSTNHWVITGQPANTAAGVAIAPAITAELRDAANTLVASYNGSATLALGATTGGATLTGTTNVTAVNGVATFSGAVLTKAFQGYTLVVGAANTVSATTNTFDVTAAGAATLAILSGNNQSGQFGAALGQPIVAMVTDAFGNAVTGTQVNFAVASGGGSVNPASATTSASGQASTQWTLGASGTQTLSVTATGLAGSPATVNAAIGAGSAASTVVAPRLDTLTSFTDTRQISPTARDQAGNIVAGTWTWVSRNPAVATVSGSGLVTSVSNGSAYIVATEALGSKDSALIVVQQRVASVNVNPASRSIYTTGTFTFTAQAVDGRGVPMVSQPTFTWTSTQPAVASVNPTTGVATGLSIGSSQIRATSGSAVGVSNLTVLTPITRIDVSYDSTGAPAPDNFTMTSLGDRRMYRALARDTLLNPMTGITFTWNSTNGSVALIDSTTATQARAVSAANGITTIQASAQGVSGGATLTVSQVLASIELTPNTATVGVGGTTPMLARGKDANGRYISGGSFAYSSATPSVATINSATGVVTGVANGTTNITATSGTITSNVAVVSVNNTGPSIISFGRDTIGVGRGTSLSVPILLSKPSASNVTVNLAVADTFAFWSAATVTIAAGQTSANATLNGRNAGTSRLFAVDGGSTGYTGDTAVVAVQANLRMTTTFYQLNANDQLSTQVLLSDPSPAGGTYVTFAYGTAGRAQVSPDPAFIPAGQLAADVVIRGLTAGSTSITPSATGVTGTAATVNVSAAQLSFGQTTIRLGQGQYEPNTYVQVPNTLFTPLTITLTSTDTSIVTVPPTVTISSPSYVYFNTTARGRGTASVIATAPGWGADTFFVQATTPKARVCCNNSSLNVTSQATNLTVYSADSTYSIHPRTSSLAVRLSSSDTTVMRVIDTLTTIAAGASSNSTNARVIPGGAGGTAWIRTSAGGHTADSVLMTVSAPKIAFSYTTTRLGNGQEEGGQYVQIPNAVGSQVVVTLTSSDSSILAVPATVTIPGNTSYTYYLMRAKSTGTATLIASAPGYAPDTATTVVTTPKIDLTGGTTINAFATTSTSAYTRDSAFAVHNRSTPLTVRLVSTDTTVLKVDSLLTIPAGQYYPNTSATVVGVSGGTAQIIATAPGHTPDTNTWTVIAPKLNLSWTTQRIGARQLQQQVYVQLPQQRTVAVPVTLTQKQPTRVALSTTSLSLPANQGYEYFDYRGLTPGRDTIIATAPGYQPDTAFVIVTTPQLDASNLPSTATTTSPPSTVYVYAADSVNGSHVANDTVVVRAFSTDSNVIRPVQQYFRILKGDYYGQVNIAYVGVGSARIVFSDSAGGGYRPDSTNLVTVTGPSLTICCGTGRLGMRQHSGNGSFYVQTQNNVNSPLVVSLISTDPRVATVPATVTIPAGQNYQYFTITALDTLGTIQIQATATGYSLGTVNMQVTAPKFVISTATQLRTTSGSTPIYVYAADANGTQHETNEDVTVTLLSSAPGVASIDSTAVTITANTSYNGNARWTPGSVGTAVLSANDNRTTFYKYGSGTQTLTVVTPQAYLSFNTLGLGIGQYSDEYVQLPDNTTVAVTVPIGHSTVPRTVTAGSVTIPASTSYEYFRITGSSIGSDTITVSPPNHTPRSGVVVVGQGRIDPLSGWPSALQAGDSVQITLYTRDPNQSIRPVSTGTTFTLAPNANVRFVSGGATITSVTVPADGNSVSFYLKGVAAGTGSATITSTNYVTYTNTTTVTP